MPSNAPRSSVSFARGIDNATTQHVARARALARVSTLSFFLRLHTSSRGRSRVRVRVDASRETFPSCVFLVARAMASLSRASASSSNVKKCPSSDAWARVSRARLERPPTRTRGRRRGSRTGVARCASASNTPTEALRRIEKAKETKRLDLSGLGLREIPPETYELEGLLELQVSNNNLYDVPESLLEKLTTIERLGLAGNRLRALPRSIGGLRALRGVWAHGNCLKEIPEELCECESLRNLVVGGNRLRALPENMSRLKSLEELSAPGNQLRALPDLGSLPLLRDIDLHGNAIERLPEDMSGLRALESLSVQGNRLKKIPKSLTTLRRLRALNLAENEIELLPDENSWMRLKSLVE